MLKPNQVPRRNGLVPTTGASRLSSLGNLASSNLSSTSFARYPSANVLAPSILSLVPKAQINADFARLQEQKRLANKAHREAVLKAYRQRATNSGPRVFDANWVEGQRRLWQKKIHTAIDVYNAHKGGGDFDYNVVGGYTPEDRFMLNGRLVNKGALGNYAAGYNSVLGAGPVIGPPLVFAGGEVYEWNAYRNGEQVHRSDGYRGPHDPPQDKAYVQEGVDDARNYLRKQKQEQERAYFRDPNRKRF